LGFLESPSFPLGSAAVCFTAPSFPCIFFILGRTFSPSLANTTPTSHRWREARVKVLRGRFQLFSRFPLSLLIIFRCGKHPSRSPFLPFLEVDFPRPHYRRLAIYSGFFPPLLGPGRLFSPRLSLLPKFRTPLGSPDLLTWGVVWFLPFFSCSLLLFGFSPEGVLRPPLLKRRSVFLLKRVMSLFSPPPPPTPPPISDQDSRSFRSPVERYPTDSSLLNFPLVAPLP